MYRLYRTRNIFFNTDEEGAGALSFVICQDPLSPRLHLGMAGARAEGEVGARSSGSSVFEATELKPPPRSSHHGHHGTLQRQVGRLDVVSVRPANEVREEAANTEARLDEQGLLAKLQTAQPAPAWSSPGEPLWAPAWNHFACSMPPHTASLAILLC